jgi:hypothetical protein
VTSQAGIDKPFPERCLRGLRDDKLAGRDQTTSIVWIMGKVFEPPWGTPQDRKFKHKSDHYETSVNWEDHDTKSFQLLCKDQSNAKYGIVSVCLIDLKKAKQFNQLTSTSLSWERDEIRGKQANPFHGNLLFSGTLSKPVVRMLAAVIANQVQEKLIFIEPQNYETELAARATQTTAIIELEHIGLLQRVLTRIRSLFRK